MNPYALVLGDRDPFKVIAETAQELGARTSGMNAETANRAPAPGKWSPREVICHLADTEVAFAFRIRQALAEPHHTIQPFDQDRWAEHYATYDLRSALNLFATLRHWNVLLLSSLAPGEFAKPLTHPERGAMTFRALVETMAGHDLNHLGQLG